MKMCLVVPVEKPQYCTGSLGNMNRSNRAVLGIFQEMCIGLYSSLFDHKGTNSVSAGSYHLVNSSEQLQTYC